MGRSKEDPSGSGGPGRMYVMAIGIDRYKAWPRLFNAVGDASGAIAAFKRLGFEEFRPPLIDEKATGQAIRDLVTDDLRSLQTNDSLVLFFAGHGYTDKKKFDDGTFAKHGYIVPVDGDDESGKIGTWVALKSWLSDISALPAKHVLVILDACHSGIALDPVIRTRGAIRLTESMDQLRLRRSRRIITSALDDQQALDGGPVSGHSLFTGCLIEALDGAMVTPTNRALVTGSELGVYVQRRVSEYSPTNLQTPDFGALEHDNRGELIISLTPAKGIVAPPPGPQIISGPTQIWAKGKKPIDVARNAEPATTTGAASITSRRKPTSSSAETSHAAPARPEPISAKAPPPLEQPAAPPENRPEPPELASESTDQPTQSPSTEANAEPTKQPPGQPPDEGAGERVGVAPSPPDASEIISQPGPSAVTTRPPRPSAPALDSAFIATLDRHERVRSNRREKSAVISVVLSDPMSSLTGWATWAAQHGKLTLVATSTGLDTTVAELLTQMPWLRILPAAAARFADAAHLTPAEIDAALTSRGAEEREAWIEEVARHDSIVRVSGWLLTMFRDKWASVPDPAMAPVQGVELLSAIDALGAPIAILLHNADPSDSWLEHALQTARELAEYVPHLSVAVGATEDRVKRVIQHNVKLQITVREGQAPLMLRPPRAQTEPRLRAEDALHQALAVHPKTANLFVQNFRVATYDRPVEVGVFANDEMLAIQIDDWYRVRDPQSYTRERTKDVWLQRAGFFVTRFLAEDIENRLERVVEEIALGVSIRRAAAPSVEKAS